jgi:predicted ArsR family transcriptional regulator
MESPRRPADEVLAYPTRAALFELLRELRREAGTAELAALLGRHVNGVRRQLEQLAEAGLVERAKRHQRRGRPFDVWSIAPGAAPRAGRSYAQLAEWLAGAIPPSAGRLREVERSGREVGRALAPAGSEGSAEAFTQVLSALGFQPELEFGKDDSVCCRLGNCPYEQAVRRNQEVVCTLHRGITAGLLDRLSPQARMTGFEPHDPAEAGCLVTVTGSSWESKSP